ncbi:TetR/AcrR family transcriptional regulator [Actinomycetospora termitidis]|uniref:TetR/AcrR family transcriptional regulator n=1 Tax=Actinomycetospora termitidis TaxID=3053470 RepID=A0ABT7M4L6_9PSEU|nr:TetR/AcrR family transcriptional regulator [Actinomycetospora sp. Odt1-22]MDL5155174.1 TetR/AcrR family transcriptional regulator [Actinomycetospora sp. Odt1-22]
MPPRRRRGNDSSALTAERIVDAALAIADSEADLDRLTVRRLAADLDVGVMTLYGYFRNKDEILDAMGDRILGSMAFPEEIDTEPAAALRTLGHAFLAMMREHPSVVRLLATRVTDSPAALVGAMEGVLHRLAAAGITGPLAVRCYGFLITYALGFSAYETPRTWGRTDDAEEARRRRSHFYAGLDRDRFPETVGLAADLPALPTDEQFADGLDAWIAGTVARVPSRRG